MWLVNKINSFFFKGANLPVMVWFHGGGFVTGSSAATFYGPGNLLDRNVILVTANYRLGVLGFLTLGKAGEDQDIQGNQGLWDQVEGKTSNVKIKWSLVVVHLFDFGDSTRFF
jgi:carboxylesterase type B